MHYATSQTNRAFMEKRDTLRDAVSITNLRWPSCTNGQSSQIYNSIWTLNAGFPVLLLRNQNPRKFLDYRFQAVEIFLELKHKKIKKSKQYRTTVIAYLKIMLISGVKCELFIKKSQIVKKCSTLEVFITFLPGNINRALDLERVNTRTECLSAHKLRCC